MDGKNLVAPRRTEWVPATRGDSLLPCGYCNQVPVVLSVAIHDGSEMTSRFCRCSRQWFDDGKAVSLAHILRSLPKGLKLARRP